jgi:hypothetical protein
MKDKYLKCCKIRLCSAACAKRASKAYHKAVCRRPIVDRWKVSHRDTDYSAFAPPVLLSKILAMAKQKGQHPLEMILVNQLVAPNSRSKPLPINFRVEIVRQFRWL